MSLDNMLNLQRICQLLLRHVQPCNKCRHAHFTGSKTLFCPRVFDTTSEHTRGGDKSHSTQRTDQAATTEVLNSNPYYAKYAEKIKKLQKSEPDQFQSRLSSLREPPQRLPEAGDISETDREPSPKNLEGLDAVMRVSLLADKSAEDIEAIWKSYHKDKDFVYAVIPASQYDVILEKSRQFPTFLLPVPRGDGYEHFVSQFREHQVHFTPLLVYQMHGENAPVAATITHYTELAADKEVVLMRGTYNKDFLTAHALGVLAQQLEHYYGAYSGDKFNLVRMFNQTPQHFDHMDLVKELKLMAGAQ